MKCPTCSIDLLMMDRQGVEIDECPQYLGVWRLARCVKLQIDVPFRDD
jgi:Zn-finger nucleic acid-binding protein